MTDPRGPWGPLAEPAHSDRSFEADDPPWRENLFLTLWDRDRRFYGPGSAAWVGWGISLYLLGFGLATQVAQIADSLGRS